MRRPPRTTAVSTDAAAAGAAADGSRVIRYPNLHLSRIGGLEIGNNGAWLVIVGLIRL